MMLSRSVIWTLTQPAVPSPRGRIEDFMPWSFRGRSAESASSRQEGSGSAGRSAMPLPGSPVWQLMAEAPRDYSDPLLNVLARLDRAAGERWRPGRAPVRQQITPEFVHAALAQWVRNDDAAHSRVDLLHQTDILDRLMTRRFLTAPAFEELREPPDRWPRPVIPRDFCDDRKTGRDLGLRPELRDARKVCYGLFRDPQLPESALDATNPESWAERCPQFWLRSDVEVLAEEQDEECDYRAGLLTEVVNLPNRLQPFGPVELTFVRATARDKTWSIVTYKLANQNAVKVDEGWYLVQRRADSANAAIMVKTIEFDRGNDWVGSVCANGLLDGAATLLDGGQGAPGGPALARPAADPDGPGQDGPGQDGVLTGVLGGYLDDCRRRWDQFGLDTTAEVKRGLAEFESRPLRFGWVDSMFGVFDSSTTFLSDSASNWADVVQQDLPDALARVDAATADRATTPATLVAAGWKAALNVYKLGNDVVRAMQQVVGPGIGRSNSALLESLIHQERSGGLGDILRRHGVAEIATAKQKLFNNASRVQTMAELEAELDAVIRLYGDRNIRFDSADRTDFARQVWNRSRARRGQAAP
jgi:hypothetical protein